jgi:hypothetical protein
VDGYGRATDFFERPSCRLKAAFRSIVGRRLQAAEKNPVVHPRITTLEFLY